MNNNITSHGRFSKAARVRNNFSIPFQAWLPQKRLERLLESKKIKFRDRIFTPIVTLILFLYQAIDADQSCKRTLQHFSLHCAERGLPSPSADTGAYCRARIRLSYSFVLSVFEYVANKLHDKRRKVDLWCGRVIKIVDGTFFTMADTDGNQKSYPQHSRQLKGCGFPIARMSGIFCYATGAILKFSFGNLFDSEIKLLKRMLGTFKKGDVLLADRYYCSYGLIGILKARGIDMITRLNQKRDRDFRRGQRICKNQRFVIWTKPVLKPRSMSEKEYSNLQCELKVRQLKIKILRQGFRTREIIILTTLLNHKKYTAQKLAEAYEKRWRCELGFRDLKITIQADFIKAKTPGMVRKEMAIRLIAFNIIKSIIYESSLKYHADPWRYSVKGTLSLFTIIMLNCKNKMFYKTILELCAENLNPDRPRRIEPRVLKMRPKLFGRMIRPRNVLKRCAA